MHPGQPQRRDEWERSSAWPAHRASPGSRGAPQRPSASGQTHPAGAGSSFRGLPLPRPVSVVEGALALLRPIRGSPPPAREMSTAPAGPTPSVYTRARRNPGSRPGPGPASGAPSRAAPAEPPAHTACTRSWAIYRLSPSENLPSRDYRALELRAGCSKVPVRRRCGASWPPPTMAWDGYDICVSLRDQLSEDQPNNR